MEQNFVESKIQKLSDVKLIDLLKLKGTFLLGVTPIAQAEAVKRNLEHAIEHSVSNTYSQHKELQHDDGKLSAWNWGAFLFSPFWALAHKLDKWAMLSMMPPFNVIAMVYLGFRGNRLAFQKSGFSLKDFLILQEEWKRVGVRIFLLTLILLIIGQLMRYISHLTEY